MKDLTKLENWTKEMIYIHRSRLLIGLFLGFAGGFLLATCLFNLNQ